MKKKNNLRVFTFCCGNRKSCPTIERDEATGDMLIRDDYGSVIRLTPEQADIVGVQLTYALTQVR